MLGREEVLFSDGFLCDQPVLKPFRGKDLLVSKLKFAICRDVLLTLNVSVRLCVLMLVSFIGTDVIILFMSLA